MTITKEHHRVPQFAIVMRRSFLATAAALGATSMFSTPSVEAAEGNAIRPFRINVPQEERGNGYALMMVTRPQTLYGLADSPAGLAAWIYDKYAAWTYTNGEPERELTKDDMLDNITLYWLTNTAISSARLYWENNANNFNASDTPISLPAAVTVYPGELYQSPRSWTERAYSKLVYFNKVDKGGHFAAWEQPELYASEARAAFRSLR
jgi:pimeloyl-ACP methyl ester carboxylesterase